MGIFLQRYENEISRRNQALNIMMTSRRVLFLLMLLSVSGYRVAGQVSTGDISGNYAGLNAVRYNPSSMHHSKAWLDIRLVGVNFFLENNYLFIHKNDYRFTRILNPGNDWPVHREPYVVGDRFLYRHDNYREKSAYGRTEVSGPGMMIIWKNHAFALSSSFRNVVSVKNLPADIANFSWLGLSYSPQYNIRYDSRLPVKIAGLSWAEIGLSYAYKWYYNGIHSLSAGVTVKRLLGTGGFFFYAGDMDYTVPDDSTILIHNMRASAGFALPLNYQDNGLSLDPMFKGGGFGIDLGFTWQRLLRYHGEMPYHSVCAQPYEEYWYRIGIGLVDLGGIRFRENARTFDIEDRSSRWDNLDDLPFSNLNSFLDTLSYQFYGDRESAWRENSFFTWLPAVITASIDYRIDRHWYFNSLLQYGLAWNAKSPVQPAVLSLSPRFESAGFEVSLPFSLYEWTKPKLGLAIRVHGITVGTDKLGSFFNLSNFSGMDLYFSIRFFLRKGQCNFREEVHCSDGTYRKQN